MTIEDVGRANCVADVAERLMPDYQRTLPLSLITTVVLRAQRELAGQALEEAFHEMLERVCRVRLTRL